MERSRCHPLCEGMQQYLPRELRDMIYGHAMGPTEWHNNNHTVSVLESNNPAGPEVVLTSSIQDFWGILRRKNHITSQTRRKLVECWYKTCTFDFATDVHLIRAFFKRDAANF
jgi:predicted nucleic acid-binding protein